MPNKTTLNRGKSSDATFVSLLRRNVNTPLSLLLMLHVRMIAWTCALASEFLREYACVRARVSLRSVCMCMIYNFFYLD